MGSPRTNPDSELNIKRIDSEPNSKHGGTHGFQVYFKRGSDEFTRLFSDSVCGGKEAARAMARAYRPRLEAAIPKSRRGEFTMLGPSRSNSGKMGISISSDVLVDGSESVFVQASVRIAPGVTKNRRFKANGETLEAVIQHADRWRKKLLAERAENEAKTAPRSDMK